MNLRKRKLPRRCFGVFMVKSLYESQKKKITKKMFWCFLGKKFIWISEKENYQEQTIVYCVQKSSSPEFFFFVKFFCPYDFVVAKERCVSDTNWISSQTWTLCCLNFKLLKTVILCVSFYWLGFHCSVFSRGKG